MFALFKDIKDNYSFDNFTNGWPKDFFYDNITSYLHRKMMGHYWQVELNNIKKQSKL